MNTRLPDEKNCRFATVAMCDTNGLLRGQKVSRASLRGIFETGMGMSPVTLALDPTDVILDLPGITDEAADFHDAPLVVDRDSARRIPWEAPGDDLLYLANYSGPAAALCPRAILARVLARAGEMGFVPKYGLELEYTLFDETPESLAAKGFRDLTPATRHASHDLVIYQAAQSDWYGAVADMCGPLGIDRPRCTRRSARASWRPASPPAPGWARPIRRCCSGTSCGFWPGGWTRA